MKILGEFFRFYIIIIFVLILLVIIGYLLQLVIDSLKLIVSIIIDWDRIGFFLWEFVLLEF